MKKIACLLFFLPLIIYAQNNTINKEVKNLKNTLLSKDYLFHSYTKKEFIKDLESIKLDSITDLNYWKIKALLSKFKEIDLSIHQPYPKEPLFKVKLFTEQLFITELPSSYFEYLGSELLEINGCHINQIKNKITNIFTLQHQNQINNLLIKNVGNTNFLKLLKFNTKNKITLKIKHQNQIKQINLTSNLNDLVALEINKKAFYQKFENKPFWQYGINFGQQIFFKITASLTKEERVYLKDSFALKNIEIARLFQIPLQQVFEVNSINYNKEKLIQKIQKKRYKQVFLDLRDYKTGTDYIFKNVLQNFFKNKRFKKKNNFYVFTNTSTSSTVIPILLYLKEHTKFLIVGTSIYGSKHSITQKEIVNLPTFNSYILIPKKIEEPILIKPDIPFETNFNQYKNGVDALLQKVL